MFRVTVYDTLAVAEKVSRDWGNLLNLLQFFGHSTTRGVLFRSSGLPRQ